MSQDDIRKYFTAGKTMLDVTSGWPQHLEASMVESLDSYMAPDDGNNATQYYSALEESGTEKIIDMSQINLEINEEEFTFSSSSLTASMKDAETQNDDDENQNLVIFKVPNSDKIYGLQTAQDEDGNLQKYQYEVIVNNDHQFETVPGTIQLVSFDTDPLSVVNQIEEAQLSTQDEVKDIEETVREEVFIKEEFVNNEEEEQDTIQDDSQLYITPDNTYEDTIQNEEQVMDDPVEQIANKIVNIQEHFQGQANSLQEILSEGILNEEEFASTSADDEVEEYDEVVPMKKEILESALKGIFSPSKSDEFELYYNEEASESPECDKDEPQEVVRLSKIESREQRTIALYPISKDSVFQNKPKTITTIQLPSRKTSKSIKINQNSPLKSLNTVKPTTASTTGPTVCPQKENLQVNKLSMMSIIKKQSGQKPPSKDIESVIADIKVLNDFDKKSDKKKQIGPWNVNKMISQTKIIEAPVRQERLPRKQKIEPLARVGDELVFQHVIVSANGVVETKVDGIIKERKVLQPSECIQLSDSDEDATHRNKKRSSRKKPIEIIISDSEEESASAHLKTGATQTSIAKCDSTAVQTSSDLVISIKQVNNCPKCSKSFPSIGSLKTHMQYHTFEETKKIIAGKYQCSRCNATFINNFLLTKHEQMHNMKSKYECPICYTLFNNQKQLSVHKRTHVNNDLDATTQKSQQFPKSSGSITRNAVSNNAIRKSHVPQSSNSKSLFLTNASRKSKIIHTTKRKSLTIPTTKRKSLSANPTSKIINPSNTNRKSTLQKLATAQNARPASSSCSAKPATSGMLTSKFLKCNTCNSVYTSKIDLDTHIINNCVKSPRRLHSTSTLISTAKKTISCSNTKENATKSNIASTSGNPNFVRPTTKCKDTLITTRSKLKSSVNSIRNFSSAIPLKNEIAASTDTLTNSTMNTNKTAISDTLNSTMNTNKIATSTIGSRNNLNATLGSAKRRRIPVNAGINVSGMMLPFLKMKRKLNEDIE